MDMDFAKMKARELHAEMKERGLWFKNGQFLTNKQKIVILEEGSLETEKVLEFILPFEKRMKKMRVKQATNISRSLIELYSIKTAPDSKSLQDDVTKKLEDSEEYDFEEELFNDDEDEFKDI